MVQDSFPALGTTWWIEVFDDIDAEQASSALGRARLLIETFEANYSRFKPDSLLSQLNHKGIFENPTSEWRDILLLGQTLYNKTNGAFNFLTGNILSNRGYDKDYSFTPTGTPEIFYDPLTDIVIEPEKVTLRQGQVDIGGYGKGYLIDRVKELFQTIGIQYFLINGGGDMYASSDNGRPLTIYLEHPLQVETYINETTLYEQGFAASSPFKRQWRHANRTYSHIVSQEPLPLTATFTKAPSAALADAFATTALLLPQTTLIELAALHGFAIAQFDPSINEIWYTQNF